MRIVCQHCKKAKATVHVTDTFPTKRERHLCEACAVKEKLIATPQTHETTHAILEEFIKHKVGLQAADDLSCPKCGMTFRSFQVKGQLGCPQDYEVFREVLDPLLKRAHEGATHHVGRVPPQADKTVHKQTGVLRLRRELQEALDQEDYEHAALLRDRIQAIEN